MTQLSVTDLILHLFNLLKIATKHEIGDLLSAITGKWKPGVSASNQAYKHLQPLVDVRKLKRNGIVYFLPHVKATWTPHTEFLTKTLVDLLKLYPDSLIYREKLLPIKIRPDALVLLKNGDKGRLLIVEVCNTETEKYLESKIVAWQSWDALPYLSELFGYRIPHYEFYIVGKDHPKSIKEELWNPS
jgi:hypothetical protein